MKAAILTEQNSPLVVADVEVPTLDVGQVLVDLAYSGICGKQLEEISGKRGPDSYLPHLLGHEGAGVVKNVGPGVRKVKAGDHVVLHWVKGSGIDSAPPRYNWDGTTVSAGWVTTFSQYTIVSENRVTQIDDDVEIGSNSCVDRAAMATTVVRSGAKLDNLVQVGHAADVGEHSMMVAFSGIAGSSKLGARPVLAARAAVLGHIELGEGTQVGVASAVRDSQPDGARVTGVPAIEHRKWLRAATAFSDLPDLVKTVRRLEARVAELEAKLEDD